MMILSFKIKLTHSIGGFKTAPIEFTLKPQGTSFF